MPLTPSEKLLVEAVDSMLQQKVHLGLDKPSKEPHSDCNPRLRGSEYLYGQINEMFMVKAADMTHHTGICAAFSKVHSYKYLDDNQFSEAMDREMVSQGIPKAERAKALEFIPKIIKELNEESGGWAERDFGFNQNLDDVMNAGLPTDK